MTGKLLAYHLKSPRVPLVVRVPQFDNHCPSSIGFIFSYKVIVIITDSGVFKGKQARHLPRAPLCNCKVAYLAFKGAQQQL